MDEKYLVALYSFDTFGPARTKLLPEYFGSAQAAWLSSCKDLVDVGLKPETAKRFIKYRDNFDTEKYFERLDKLKVNFVTWKDNDYPENLKDLDNAPLVLYYKGELKKSDFNAVAIVGSRKMTSYGREIAYKFSFDLSGMGIAIVSGLALGIDAVSHQAVVDSGGRGIAVLASGLDKITPSSNIYLAKNLIEKGGCIVSEYPLGHNPTKIDFPNRNRIISGLSKIVLVVEGAKKSGTLLTASHAADQGRTVFAVPGQVTSPMSEAPHFLIQNGAKIAFSPKDILDELGIEFKVNREVVEMLMPTDEVEIKILKILEREPLHLDEIIRVSNLNTNLISSKITTLELKGLIKNITNGYYKKL